MQREIHPSEDKVKEVALLKDLLISYKTVAVIDLKNLPSPQLQKMRKKLKDVLIRVTKKRLLMLALKETGNGLENLNEFLTENVMPALIFTNDSPFKLSKFLRQNKSQVAAKSGQISPKDIIVSPGPTSLPAGPVIGELGAVGIKASVENGKITIKQESTIVKEGEAIKPNVADILVKLGIKPMEIGLNLVAAFENGTVFGKQALDVDDKFYINALKSIARDALNLTVSIGYVTEDNINLILSKAEREALALDKIINKDKDKLKSDLAQADKEADVLIKDVESNIPKEGNSGSQEEAKEKSQNNNQEGGN